MVWKKMIPIQHWFILKFKAKELPNTSDPIAQLKENFEPKEGPDPRYKSNYP